MMAHARHTLALILISVLLVSATPPARAQAIVTDNPSKLAGIAIGLAAIGAGVGIRVYVAVHHSHRLTGCAVAGASGLQLRSPADQQTYGLTGEVSRIKPGERVRVLGKKSKKGTDANRQFLVEELEKDFGVCKVSPRSGDLVPR